MANLLFILPVFMGLGPLRITDKQSKGADRRIIYLIKVTEIVRRFRKLDIPT